MEHVSTIKALITTALLVFAVGSVWLMRQRPPPPKTVRETTATRREQRLMARLARRLDRQARARRK